MLVIFDEATDPGTAVATGYDPVLVAASVLLAGLAGRVALQFAEHPGTGWGWLGNGLWLAGGATVLGFGMWTMHFVGMLALELPLAQGYEPVLTAVSVVPAIAGSAPALWWLQRGIRGWLRLNVVALALGLGVGGMHYTGMAAMSVAGAMRFDALLVVVSLIVAHGLALPAVAIQARTIAGESDRPRSVVRTGAAAVLGLAIAGMHYTGMTAASFFDTSAGVAPGTIAPSGTLTSAVLAAGAIIMAGTLLAMWVDAQRRRLDRRYRAILDSLGASILVADPVHGVTFANRSARAILGGAPNAIAGEEGLAPQLGTPGEAWDNLRAIAAGEAGGGQGNDAIFHRIDGTSFPAGYTVAPLAGDSAAGASLVLTFRDISVLRRYETDYRSIFEHVVEGVYRRTLDGELLRANPALVEMHGVASEDELIERSGNIEQTWYPDEASRDGFLECMARDGYVKHYEYRMMRVGVGDAIWVSENARPVHDSDGGLTLYEGTISDISERKRLETDLLQAQKLEAVGQLASGIAHEINTPTQYVRDNLEFVADAFQDLEPLLARYQELVQACEAAEVETEQVGAVRTAEADADLAFVRDELPQAVSQAQEGNERVGQIVRAMKDFSHPDGEGKQQVDINRMIETTVTVARNEWKYVADLQLDFDDSLPQVPAKRAELSQAVLNVVVNAAQALEEQGRGSGASAKGSITVATREASNSAVVEITDDGPGMPESVRQRVFDPFYTTKNVGRGTGQGLAMTRSVVADKHNGGIEIFSEPEAGTRVRIVLPIDDRDTENEA